jgi:hypothetical protein
MSSNGPADYSQYDPDWDGVSPAEPRRKSNSRWWFVVVLTGLGGGVLFLCCGGGFLLFRFVFGVISAEVEMQLRDNPTLREHIGEIQTFEIDWTRSLAEDNDDVFVYRVRGSKAEGVVTVKHVTNDVGDEEIKWAELRTASGETVNLIP